MAKKAATKKRKVSALEAAFRAEWERQMALDENPDGLRLVAEYRFHPEREWRSDFAHVMSRTLIEIEGGAFSGGRHTRGKGFVEDCNKYLSAHLRGWTVVRLTGKQITAPIIAALIGRTRTATRERMEGLVPAASFGGKARSAASFSKPASIEERVSRSARESLKPIPQPSWLDWAARWAHGEGGYSRNWAPPP